MSAVGADDDDDDEDDDEDDDDDDDDNDDDDDDDDEGSDGHDSELFELHTYCGCAIHDAQNSLKWSQFQLFNDSARA
eukprot:2010499-Amphidinium_carterae.1